MTTYVEAMRKAGLSESVIAYVTGLMTTEVPAASEHGLRARLLALADEWESARYAIPSTSSQIDAGIRASLRGCTQELRAALRGDDGGSGEEQP